MCCVFAGDAYVSAAEALKLATGPYKASRDAYVAASTPPHPPPPPSLSHLSHLSLSSISSLSLSSLSLSLSGEDLVQDDPASSRWIDRQGGRGRGRGRERERGGRGREDKGEGGVGGGGIGGVGETVQPPSCQ